MIIGCFHDILMFTLFKNVKNLSAPVTAAHQIMLFLVLIFPVFLTMSKTV